MTDEEFHRQMEKSERAIEMANRMIEQIDETLRYTRPRRIKREAELRRLGVLPPSNASDRPGWLRRVLSSL